MKTYAYIRVSTKEQNIDRQLMALRPYGVLEENIFCDYQSGKDFERNGYQQLLDKLERGDLLIIKSIDRLGRNYKDILLQWQRITKEIGADIAVIDMELLDTRIKVGGLTGMLVSDLVLQIFAYVAQLERESIHQRQAEGIAAARAKGKHLGRSPIALPDDEFERLCEDYATNRTTLRAAAGQLGISHTTFRRRYAEYMQKNKKIAVTKGRLKDTV